MRLRDYVIDAIVDHFGLMVFALVTLAAAITIDIIHFGSAGPLSLFWLVVLGFILVCIVEGAAESRFFARIRP